MVVSLNVERPQLILELNVVYIFKGWNAEGGWSMEFGCVMISYLGIIYHRCHLVI